MMTQQSRQDFSRLAERVQSHFVDGDIAARLAAEFTVLGLPERLALMRDAIPGRIVFTTSFGIEDQAITHAIFTQSLAIDVVTLDTGRLFPETYQLWADTEHRYGRRISGFFPEHQSLEALIARQGINGFCDSVEARHACCAVRKVAPLGRALADASAWVTGIRAEQSTDRSRMAYATIDPAQRIMKVNPLLDWTRVQVSEFVREHGVPYNPLHDRGFLSIGCAPCTRAVAPGEAERDGRWWWERDEKKECGLHNRPGSPLDPRESSARSR